MHSGEMAVSADALIHIFVFSLYVPVGLISYRQMLPRLSLPSKRLATVMLAAQILVIVLALRFRTASDYDVWLWDLDREWNIPSTLASTQLLMISGVALLTAWLAQTRPTSLRLYLLGIVPVFLFLAWDEYHLIHDALLHWETYYITLGVIVAAATAVIALCSPRRIRIWHLCFLTGLAISGVGALGIEQLRHQDLCGSLGFMRLEGCLEAHDFEEIFELLGIWLALVAMLGHFSEVEPTPPPRVRRILYALPALWVLLLFLSSLTARAEFQLLSRPASVQFESDVVLHGYRIDRRQGSAVFRLYTSATQWDYAGQRYSLQMVDQVRGGKSVVSSDNWADHQFGFWLLGPDYAPLYREWIEVVFPPQVPVNRALWAVLTLWRKIDGEFMPQAVLSSDHRLLDETQVVLGELVLPAKSTDSAVTPLAVFDSGFALEAVDMSDRARPGETLDISFAWRSATDGAEDYVQFLHFGHEASGAWWTFDQRPLGARLPSRLWYGGLADSEVWQVPIPADLAPGRYALFTGLYRARDLERVPVSDAKGLTWLDARVPLSVLTLD